MRWFQTYAAPGAGLCVVLMVGCSSSDGSAGGPGLSDGGASNEAGKRGDGGHTGSGSGSSPFTGSGSGGKSDSGGAGGSSSGSGSTAGSGSGSATGSSGSGSGSGDTGSGSGTGSGTGSGSGSGPLVGPDGGTLVCSPNQIECQDIQVVQCNPTGSAWLLDAVCSKTCTAGLCDAPCTPNSTRCNGTNVDTCNSAGSAWTLDTTSCTTGCLDGTCLEPDLVVDGVSVTMDGDHHYPNSVLLKNGGSIQVGTTGYLGLYAPTIDVQVASSITATTHAAACSAVPDSVANGIRLQGTQVTVDGSVTWSASGCAVDGIVVRADTINGSGTLTSDERLFLLYGTGGVGTTLNVAPTAKSLMPPTIITSTAYPFEGTYNDDGPHATYAWDKPYSNVAGYYYTFGATSEVPTATSTYTATESLALANAVLAGANFLDIVTLDGFGNVGTVPHEYQFTINTAPPALASTTNPTQGTYSTNQAVVMSWTGGVAENGYGYLLDHYPDTRPNGAAATWVPAATNQVLLPSVAAGRWWFHILSLDGMGYATHGAEHYELDIGTAPAAGTIAGTVLDPMGNPLVGAEVVVQRGLYTTVSTTGGVYTFGNAAIPAGSYEVVAAATGHESEQQTLVVTASQTTDGVFTLPVGSGCPSCSDPCSGLACPLTTATACTANVETSPPLWNATCEVGTCWNGFGAGPTNETTCPYGCNGNVCSTTECDGLNQRYDNNPYPCCTGLTPQTLTGQPGSYCEPPG